MKTDSELKQIALELWRGDIFSDRHINNPNDLGRVFMPLRLMDKEGLENLMKSNPEFIYEYMHKAAPQGVNGMPCFFSFQFLNKEETTKMFQYYRNMEEHYNNLPNMDAPPVESEGQADGLSEAEDSEGGE